MKDPTTYGLLVPNTDPYANVDELRRMLAQPSNTCLTCGVEVSDTLAFCSRSCQRKYTTNPAPLTPQGEACCDPDAYTL